MNNICVSCARQCKIDRNKCIGYCRATATLRVAKVMVHHWEEPIISGTIGSGTIFFCHCNLRCVFCQNYPISHDGAGKDITVAELTKIFQELESSGVHNINLVTPTHYVDQIIGALDIYRPAIPIVWNTNGYENPETIDRLKDYVDIFLFDLKYMDESLSKKYSDAADYFDIASRNILQARQYMPRDIISDGIMQRGIIVRHLVLPSHTDDSVRILGWIKENLPDTLVSIMSQYIPYYKAKDYPEINRKISKLEYKRVVTCCENLGLNGFTQGLDSADTCYTPDFDKI